MPSFAMLARVFYRYPRLPAQEWAWKNWIGPLLLWRPLTLRARTCFGAQIPCTLSNSLHARIYFFGFWEPTISAYVASRLKPGDIFIDIGANIGYYSLLASRRVGHDGRVFAYEASPTVFDQLRKNLTLNHASNVAARNVAITDQPCEVPIYVNRERMGESTILTGVAAKIDAPLEANVSGHPLGDLLGDDVIRAARFIKIDVEGAEWLVVKGIQHLIPTLSESTEIIIEINTESVHALGGSTDHLLGLFTQAGFSAFEINNSYELAPYIGRDQPRLTAYDGKPFARKDFILRRDHV